MATIEATQDEMREQVMEKNFGRRILPNLPFRTTQPILKAHTPEEELKLIKIYEQENKWVLKGADGKPDPESKDFFYKIVSILTACLGSDESEYRINYQYQKYWRNKTYQTQISPENSNMRTVNEPYMEMFPKGDRLGRDGGLKRTGEAFIDADEFLKRFMIDRTE
jgi:hypothetical protein